MGESDRAPGRPWGQQADQDQPQLRVFINYRHDDAWGQAELLYDRLANSFGSESVFLDARNLQPGMDWLQEIKSHRDSCRVLLALIGPAWMSIMRRREQEVRERESRGEPDEDYVRFELEYALRRSSGIHVIPVLVGDTVPFTAEGLPRSLEPLTDIEAPYLMVVDQRRLGRGQGGGPTRGQLLRINPFGYAATYGYQPWFEDFQHSNSLFPIQ